MAHYAAATLHLVKGDWAEARTLTARQIAVLRAGNVAGELPTALALSARALGHLGDAAAALAACREAEQLLESRSARERVGNGWVHCSLGRAYLLLGRLDDAARLGTPAGESASGRVDFVPDALQLLGDLATHPDRFDAERGRVYYGRALALAEARGMRPLVAHCHLGLGQLYRRAGDVPEAQEHLTTAATMYREMGMNFWLEKAKAELEPPRGSPP
jgi:tetratricopeptide (TPR) repeat protein